MLRCRHLLALAVIGIGLISNALAQDSDTSIVDAINKALRQEVQRTTQSVESQKPVVPPKPVELLPADWLSQISQDYTITREANQAVPLARLAWYLQHRQALQQQLTQTRSIIYRLTKRLKAQELPTELALIPLVTQGASLQLDAAALSTMKRLQPTLKDPLLLLAVYASSASGVQTLVAAHPNTRFWQISWPPRTMTFVANLVALAQLVQHADYYGLNGKMVSEPVPPALVPSKFVPLSPEVTPTLLEVIERMFPPSKI